jgi:hypothetical protein
MRRGQSLRGGAAGLVIAISIGAPALAQQPGGTLRVHAGDSPPSLSMHEEIDAQPARMTMPIFNKLDLLEVACKHCDRQGRVARPAHRGEEHGSSMGLPDLREILAGDCPRARAVAYHERCQVHFPQLPALFVN